ncbi:hypothetical protein [Nonomuraea sp. NPDC049684]|uniref:hypothetical protein n=1 Tax=unclassified Nonomuraea TaxID=2593643 RepID=UPI00378D2424
MSLKDQPEFRTVYAPDAYPRTTASAVRYVPVLKDGAVAWTGRLRWAKANGVTPLRALRHWAGEAEDARAGQVPVRQPFELPSLSALEELAAAA